MFYCGSHILERDNLMKLAIEGDIKRKPSTFRLIQAYDVVRLEIDSGNGFMTVASFNGNSGKAFLCIDRMKLAGFSVFDGGNGRMLND